jgi:hypothetical protein
MEWYLKALLRDRRFKIAGAVAAGSLVTTMAAFLIGRSWSIKLAEFGFLPVLVVSIAAMFVILGLIIRSDYRERSAFKGWK